jgi:hypothetical protein
MSLASAHVSGATSVLLRRRLVQAAGSAAFAALSGCGLPETTQSARFSQFPARLNGEGVVVSYFADLRPVRQDAADLCWAACLEQALAFQGVEVTQREIVEEVFPKARPGADRSLDMFWFHQYLSIDRAHRPDGTEVWYRTDIDGDVDAPILSIRTFRRKLGWELAANRIVLAGLRNPGGGGHVVNIVGAAFPITDRTLQADRIVGYLLYDPSSGRPDLLSDAELFDRCAAMIYVTVYATAAAATTGGMVSTKSRL